MTELQRVKALQRAERKISKCNGNCSHCDKLHMYTASAGRSVYYAWGCDNLPTEIFDSISGSVGALKNDALEAVRFELS